MAAPPGIARLRPRRLGARAGLGGRGGARGVCLDGMWAEARAIGRAGALAGLESAPRALRRAPRAVRPAPRAAATSGSVQRVRLGRAGRAGGRGGGPRGERRAPRSCPRLPLAASAETAPARAARGAARSGGAFLPPRPRDSPDLRAEKAEPGRGGRAESGRRRFGPAAGGPSPRPGVRAPLSPSASSRSASPFIFSNAVAARGAALNS